MASFTLIVNGTQRRITVADYTPLLYVLRNELRLTSPRLGCGLGQCGACAVLIDGVPSRSCITQAAKVAGKAIHTIEGLPALWAKKRGLDPARARDVLHPVQQAWIDEQVPQCGYCQSGMMIAAVGLLDRNPNPTMSDIVNAFSNTPPSPHLCRCGTYPAIRDAVQRAAKAMTTEREARK